MCYLIAKERESYGCFALKTEHGEKLAKFKTKLNKQIEKKGIQLVTISRPSAYGEYAPYEFVEDEQQFEEKVIKMGK